MGKFKIDLKNWTIGYRRDAEEGFGTISFLCLTYQIEEGPKVFIDDPYRNTFPDTRNLFDFSKVTGSYDDNIQISGMVVMGNSYLVISSLNERGHSKLIDEHLGHCGLPSLSELEKSHKNIPLQRLMPIATTYLLSSHLLGERKIRYIFKGKPINEAQIHS